MDKKRKIPFGWIVLGIVLAIVLVFLFRAGFFGIHISKHAEGALYYVLDGVPVDAPLTAEEILTIRELLRDERAHTTLIGVPACSFDENVAFEVDGIRYWIATDTCGTLRLMEGFFVIDFSDEEAAVIHQMYIDRWGKFF